MVAALDAAVLEAAELHGESAEVHFVPGITALMARCGDLLASMQQPDESAESSLLSMLDELEEWDLEGSDENGAAELRTGRPGALADLDAVGLHEKVAWMLDKQDAGEQRSAAAGLDTFNALTPEGSIVDAMRVVAEGGAASEQRLPYISAAALCGDADGGPLGLDAVPFVRGGDALGDAMGAAPGGAVLGGRAAAAAPWEPPYAASVVSVEGCYAHLTHAPAPRVSEPATSPRHSAALSLAGAEGKGWRLTQDAQHDCAWD